MASNSTSLTSTPHARDDQYNFTEDGLLLSAYSGVSYNDSTRILTLNVLANDLGGAGKVLFSVDDGNGHTSWADYDLLNKDAVGDWEASANGNLISISGGKISLDITAYLASKGVSSLNALTADDHLHDEFVYAIRLGNGALSQATVTVDIQGSNDAATFGGDDSATLAEDVTTVSGLLTVSDADRGQSSFQADTIAGQYGDLTIDADGSWSYTLGDGQESTEQRTDILTVRSSDGTEHHVSITIEGRPDEVAVAPNVSADDAERLGNGPIALDISAALVDTDGSESLSITISGVPTGWSLSAGTLIGEESGTYALAPDDLDGLHITPPNGTVGSIELTITATATEASNGDTASTTSTISVEVSQADSLQGQAIEGYIAGATVFADADEDGMLDTGEARATTDANGNFTLVGGTGPLVMFGGIDVSTGLAFEGTLRAPEGSSVVTPLTTLIAALVDQGQTVAQATGNVASALGLDGLEVGGQPIDLLSFDPVALAVAGGADGDAAAQVLAAGIQVQNAIVQISALLTGAGATDASSAVVQELANLVETGTAVDLAASTTIGGLINASAEAATGIDATDIDAVVADASVVLAAANAAIDDALAGGSGVAVLEDLARVAAVAQGDAVTDDLADAGATEDSGSIATDYTGVNLVDQLEDAEIGDVDGAPEATLGSDTLAGGAGNDAISGLEGNDSLIGSGGDDTLLGGPGHDTLQGGPGNDVLNGGILANFYTVEGFADTDRADYSTAAAGVNVNLATGVAFDGDGGIDTLIGIEAVIGSDANDTFTGSGAFFELYRGRGGNDTINGGFGNDRVLYNDAGATGPINVLFGSGNPAAPTSAGVVVGDSYLGTDTLIDVEQIVGTTFADTFVVSGFLTASGTNQLLGTFARIEGDGGNDTITGNGNTGVSYQNALEAVTVTLTASPAFGGSSGTAVGGPSVGTDTFVGGISQVRGSAYADHFIGGNATSSQLFEGNGGDDTIDGGSGFDTARYLFDGPISVGLIVNMAAGEVIGDPIYAGTDTLRSVEAVQGSILNDTYNAVGYGAAGATNVGNNGTFNEFEGGAGNDTITGNGNTRISYISAREAVTVNLSGTVTGGASVGTDTLISGVTAVRGSNFDDLLIGTSNGTTFTQVYQGRGGDDTIIGGGGADQVEYQDDFVFAGISAVIKPATTSTWIVTGDSQVGTDELVDVFSIRATSFADTYNATGYNNLVSGFGNFNQFEGFGGNDTIIGNGNTRIIYQSAAGGVNVQFTSPGAGSAVGDGTVGTDTFSGVSQVRGSNFNDTMTGSSGNEVFDGRGGDDAINGGAGFDQAWYDAAVSGGTFTINASGVVSAAAGGQGLDTLTDIDLIRATNFNDVYDGSAFAGAMWFDGFNGNDTFKGGSGFDTFNGGGGTDRLDYSAAAGAVTVNLAASTGPDQFSSVEEVIGSAYADIITGDAAANRLDGGDGNDSLSGGGNNDTVNGGAGDDTLIGGAGFDVLNGGILSQLITVADFLDQDRADYSAAAGPVTVSLAAGTASNDGDVASDTLIGIEGVVGSAFADLITGSGTFSEFYTGGAGNDTINGGLFNDRAIYDAATGFITVNLGSGNAASPNDSGTVVGDASVGTDTLTGVEQIRGTNGSDFYTVVGFSSASSTAGLLSTFNEFEGLGGNDTITGNGATRVSYQNALEAVTVNLVSATPGVGGSSGTAIGGASVGTDTFSGVSQARGGAYADTFNGGTFTGTQQFEGRAGDDTINGGDGFDIARYAFDGAISAGITVDLADGIVTGDPILTGTDHLTSVEAVMGSILDDYYDATGYGSVGANVGNNGTFNEFEGMAGDDTIITNGNTRISYVNAREAVTVTLTPTGGSATGGASVGTDTITGVVTQIRGSNFDDVLTGFNHSISVQHTIEGRGGNDTIDGGGGFDQAAYNADPTAAGIAVDMANANSFTGTVIGDAAIGTDTLIRISSVRGTNFADSYDATGFNSNIPGLGTFNEFEGGGGNDSIIGNGNTRISYGNEGAAVSVVFAGAGSGTAIGATAGTDTFTGVSQVRGSNFNDTITGSAGNEVFDGRGGDDVIDAGGGFDQARYDAATAGGLFVFNAAGLITATVGGQGTDSLTGVEYVRGTNSADTYDASAFGGGFNRFEGLGGNDTIIGNGFTEISFQNSGSAVTANLGSGQASGASIGTDSLSGVNQILGSNFSDTLIGSDTSAIERYNGSGGDDTIDGAGGFDHVMYDGTPIPGTFVVDAAGTIIATVGAVGGQGTDTLYNIEHISATNADDSFDSSAYAGHISFAGNAGNDTIIGGGATQIDYLGAGAAVNVNLQAGTAQGAATGNDQFSGVNNVTGSTFNDTITGAATNDILWGMAGNDTITGGQGDDTLRGGDSFGSAGADLFVWNLGDQGSVAVPAVDTIEEFVDAGDALKLQDLLIGETHVGNDPGNLDSYLDFTFGGGNTTIHVKTTGSGGPDQQIVLLGVDLNAGNTLTDNQVITNLLTAGRLITE